MPAIDTQDLDQWIYTETGLHPSDAVPDEWKVFQTEPSPTHWRYLAQALAERIGLNLATYPGGARGAAKLLFVPPPLYALQLGQLPPHPFEQAIRNGNTPLALTVFDQLYDGLPLSQEPIFIETLNQLLLKADLSDAEILAIAKRSKRREVALPSKTIGVLKSRFLLVLRSDEAWALPLAEAILQILQHGSVERSLVNDLKYHFLEKTALQKLGGAVPPLASEWILPGFLLDLFNQLELMSEAIQQESYRKIYDACWRDPVQHRSALEALARLHDLGSADVPRLTQQLAAELSPHDAEAILFKEFAGYDITANSDYYDTHLKRMLFKFEYVFNWMNVHPDTPLYQRFKEQFLLPNNTGENSRYALARLAERNFRALSLLQFIHTEPSSRLNRVGTEVTAHLREMNPDYWIAQAASGDPEALQALKTLEKIPKQSHRGKISRFLHRIIDRMDGDDDDDFDDPSTPASGPATVTNVLPFRLRQAQGSSSHFSPSLLTPLMGTAIGRGVIHIPIPIIPTLAAGHHPLLGMSFMYESGPSHLESRTVAATGTARGATPCGAAPQVPFAGLAGGAIVSAAGIMILKETMDYGGLSQKTEERILGLLGLAGLWMTLIEMPAFLIGVPFALPGGLVGSRLGSRISDRPNAAFHGEVLGSTASTLAGIWQMEKWGILGRASESVLARSLSAIAKNPIALLASAGAICLYYSLYHEDQ